MCCYTHNLYNNEKKNFHALWFLNSVFGICENNILMCSQVKLMCSQVKFELDEPQSVLPKFL